MGFKKITTEIEGLWIIEPDVFGDARGFFMEGYNRSAFEHFGLNVDFKQDNLSYSRKGILRGLHFQAPPFAQGKLVSVVLGEVLDVAVDIRKDSPTYGKHLAVHLSGENHRMLYVPPGFAHGFLVLSDECYFSYKCTEVYNKEAEGGLMWNDEELKINWEVENPIVSEKDKHYAPFWVFDTPFK